MVTAVTLSAGMYAAIASSITSSTLGTALNGGSFGDCFLAGTKGGIYGAMSAMATAGIGDIFVGVGSFAKGSFSVWRELGRAGAHSLAQGTIAVLQGGDFWQGAASGALGSIGASIYGGDNLWVTVAISSVSGGIGSVIGGARSAEDILFGMATGAIVGALNHWPHLKQKASAKQKVISYLRQVEEAGGMTLDWIAGVDYDIAHINNEIANALKNSPGIINAIEDYYLSGKTSGHYDFGLKGLFKAGFDLIEQFIGSYSYKILNLDGTLQITVTNTTSFASAAYHLWPYKWNWDRGIMSNFKQTYIFSYP